MENGLHMCNEKRREDSGDALVRFYRKWFGDRATARRTAPAVTRPSPSPARPAPTPLYPRPVGAHVRPRETVVVVTTKGLGSRLPPPRQNHGLSRSRRRGARCKTASRVGSSSHLPPSNPNSSVVNASVVSVPVFMLVTDIILWSMPAP